MQFTPYLNFNGDCEAAFRFYERVLGGKIEIMQTHGESPIAGEVPPTWHSRILHARLTVGDAVLMASDTPPEMYQQPQGLTVSIGLQDIAEAERIFRELAEGGRVTMPIGKTFWAERFGMLVDRFGIPWMINCDTTVGSGTRGSANELAGAR
jgi:PhnB protein